MKIFEIHITGDENIHKLKDIKTITVEDLSPNGDIININHMTSHVIKKDSIIKAINIACDLATDISKFSQLKRLKVESPYYPEFYYLSLYLESHINRDIFKLPTSRNKNKLMATDRIYRKDEYKKFREVHSEDEIEMCLIDNGIDQDQKWMSLYANN